MLHLHCWIVFFFFFFVLNGLTAANPNLYKHIGGFGFHKQDKQGFPVYVERAGQITKEKKKKRERERERKKWKDREIEKERKESVCVRVI